MKYYYLIAGLPDLSPGMDTRKIDFNEVAETIQRNLEPDDKRQFRYLLYPRDNRNLLNVLWAKYKDFPQQGHVSPCIVNEEELQDYRSHQSTLPSYMGDFLSLYEDQFPNMSPREMEDRLWEGFYEEVNAQSSFIKGYFQFEKSLKEILAAYNSSYYDFLSPPSAIDESILGQVGKGKSVTPGLQREHPYIEELYEKLETQRPDQLEKFINQIKWDYLEEVNADFGLEQVLAYTIRLLLTYDIDQRQLEKGASRLVELQENIKNRVQSPIISIT